MFGNRNGEETEVRCKVCGTVSTSQKPGLSGRSLLSCSECKEKTVHKIENG